MQIYFHILITMEKFGLYSNSVNEGAESYHMEKYEGADKLVAKMNFSEKFADANNPKAGKKYVLNG